MHILNGSLGSNQTIKITPRIAQDNVYLALMIDEQTGKGFLTAYYGSDVSVSNSYVTLTDDFEHLTNERSYYLRVFYNATISESIQVIIDAGPTEKTTLRAIDEINGYLSEGYLSDEVYRGKVFTTASTDLPKYSMFSASPYTQTSVKTTANWITP